MDYSSLINKTGLSTDFSDIASIINTLVPLLFTGAGLLMLLYLLYGGYHFLISAGDPKAIQEAKGKITFAIVGFLVIFLAYWLVLFLSKMLGIEGFKGVF